MKPSRRQILPLSFLSRIALASTVIILLTGINSDLKAQPVPVTLSNPQIVHDLNNLNGVFYPTNPQQFFEEGRCQCEREIQNLLNRQLSSPEILLKIDEQLLRQETIAPPENLENQNVAPAVER